MTNADRNTDRVEGILVGDNKITLPNLGDNGMYIVRNV